MDLSGMIIEEFRKAEYAELDEATAISDDLLVSLYIFKTRNIKPGKNDVRGLEKFGMMKSGKITKNGLDYLNSRAVKKKIKDMMS